VIEIKHPTVRICKDSGDRQEVSLVTGCHPANHNVTIHYLAIFAMTKMTNNANRTQMDRMRAAAIQLVSFRRVMSVRAFSRHSARTVGGIIFNAKAMPKGTNIRSSRYPRTGMKSGIRSMGLKAYPMTQAIRSFAYQGTRGSL